MREGYKKTEVGVIPEDWEVVQIKDVSEFCSNGFVGTASPYYVEEGVPYLMSNNVRENRIDENKLVNINYEFATKYPRTKIYKGDMLTVQSGHIGTSCVVSDKFNNCNCHALIITRFNKEIINSEFCAYYLNSSKGKNRLSDIFVGTTIKHINVKDFIKFRIPIPILKEQEKIAEILSTFDTQIDDTEKLIEKTKELKKGLMQQLLAKGIGHKEFKKTKIGEIPVEWEVKMLHEIANIKRGASPRPIKDPKWFSDDKNIGWVRISDVTASSKYLINTVQYLSEEGKCKSRFVKNNDLIMSICATVGKPILMKMDACIHDGFVLLDEIDSGEYDKEFLYYVLQNYENNFKSMGQTGTQSNLNTELVGGLIIGVPFILEQEKIAQILSLVDNEIEEYKNKKEKLEELKMGLMQHLVTGKIRTVI